MPRMAETRLFAVASPGRSGTAWYAALFTTPRSYCFHELTSRLRRYPANVVALDRLEQEAGDHSFAAMQRRLVLEAYPAYFDRMWERADRGCGAVGNSDHLSLRVLAGLWLTWPRMRFLVSFANGIHDVDASAPTDDTSVRTVAAIQRLRFETSDPFEQRCRDWAASVALLETHRDWLRARDAAVLETRRESLLSDEGELQRVGGWLTGDARPVQPPDDEPRAPEEIWSGWSTEQRALFTEICGDAQTRLGYALPG